MRFFQTALSLACLAGSALAQLELTSIIYPPAGTTLTAGSDFIVQVGMEDYISSVDVLVVAVGLAVCSNGDCIPADEELGQILYQGNWTYEGAGGPEGRPYDNYTVTVPEGFPAGTASLNVVNFFTVGASNEPTLNYVNQTVTIVSA